MTNGVRCLLKGPDASINGFLDSLNLILCLIRFPSPAPESSMIRLPLHGQVTGIRAKNQAFWS